MKTVQEIFESELCDEAKHIFRALPDEEKRRIVAVRLPPTLKGTDEDFALLNGTIYDSIVESRFQANAEEVETFGLVDVVTSRGWVRYKDVYAPPYRIETWKRIEAQEEADARDLELGRNFGATLSRIEAHGDRIEAKVGETAKGIAKSRKEQLTRAHYDRVNGIEPDTRNHGGGRKVLKASAKKRSTDKNTK